MIEDTSLRDYLYVFEDRAEAGRHLALKLKELNAAPDAIVLAVPCGGVAVAAEIARALALPLEVLLVRKLNVPWSLETGFGAICPDGKELLNDNMMTRFVLDADEVKNLVKKARTSYGRLNSKLRNKRPFPDLEGKTVIIVDDGVSSGYTMLSALHFVKRRGPKMTIVAVPTAYDRTLDLLVTETDEIICLNVRGGLTFAVSDSYVNWTQASEKDVLAVLGSLRG